MKAKVHAIELHGETHLIMARTKAGARRDLIEHIVGDVDQVAIATGEQIYQAGREGREIIGIDRYTSQEDPNQIPLDGVPEAANVSEGEKAAAAAPF